MPVPLRGSRDVCVCGGGVVTGAALAVDLDAPPHRGITPAVWIVCVHLRAANWRGYCRAAVWSSGSAWRKRRTGGEFDTSGLLRTARVGLAAR